MPKLTFISEYVSSRPAKAVFFVVLTIGALTIVAKAVMASTSNSTALINNRLYELLPQHSFAVGLGPVNNANCKPVYQKGDLIIYKSKASGDSQSESSFCPSAYPKNEHWDEHGDGRRLAHQQNQAVDDGCGYCEVLRNVKNQRFFIIRPMITATLKSGVNIDQLESQLQQLEHLEVVNLNSRVAVVKVLHQPFWLQIYQYLQSRTDVFQFVEADLSRRVRQSR